LSDGKGNSISIRGLAVAADGTLLIVGDTACCLQGRSGMQLFAQTLGVMKVVNRLCWLSNLISHSACCGLRWRHRGQRLEVRRRLPQPLPQIGWRLSLI
jgi:hypothetical protein